MRIFIGLCAAFLCALVLSLLWFELGPDGAPSPAGGSMRAGAPPAPLSPPSHSGGAFEDLYDEHGMLQIDSYPRAPTGGQPVSAPPGTRDPLVRSLLEARGEGLRDGLQGLLAGGSPGGRRVVLDALEVWIARKKTEPMRLAAAALVALGDPGVACMDLLAVADRALAGGAPPDALGRLGNAIVGVLEGGGGLPFGPLPDGAAIRFLAAAESSEGATRGDGGGILAAWVLAAAPPGDPVAAGALANLALGHPRPEARRVAMMNLGKITTVRDLVERVGLQVEARPASIGELRLQEGYLLGILRAYGKGRGDADLAVPLLRTALEGWGRVQGASAPLANLLSGIRERRVPGLREPLAALAAAAREPALALMARRILEESDPLGEE